MKKRFSAIFILSLFIIALFYITPSVSAAQGLIYTLIDNNFNIIPEYAAWEFEYVGPDFIDIAGLAIADDGATGFIRYFELGEHLGITSK